ncbi:folate-dependent protein inplicated in Fe-S cluster metabolism YgfZ [Cyanobacterium sp. HL-69]|uniref:CAF17-like 4Fe-4S cluster assembly/insertion protein YgfZ n=1 Tax=Cyanobacterium sp. HL-69 TaxID=2054282 RepID=UPI000CA1756F|nr:folate-dependent protein inplicated in Fe-S cluster metabolism YgfZ [Cyanobacterium sp. HL-69]
MTSLQDLQKAQGAIFSESDSTPSTFNNDSTIVNQAFQEVALCDHPVALCDRTCGGLIKVSGEDRLSFIHNQTTNKIQSLKNREGAISVFVNSTGRTIDLVTVIVKEKELLILTSPQQNQPLMQWMDRYIFPFDKVELEDLTGKYAIFTLIGEKSPEILAEWATESQLHSPEFSHHDINIDDTELTLINSSSLKIKGYTLIIPQDNAPRVWEKLSQKKVSPIGNEAYEKLRIMQGKPKPNHELTTDYNPLEAGLWDAISFDKGCYIGQETIARLNTYKGVKQRLWGIKFASPVNLSESKLITLNGEKVGTITSHCDTPEGIFALGYIRTKAGGEGLKVMVNEVEGEVISLPFVRHPEA